MMFHKKCRLSEKEIEDRAKKLMAQMTLKEKVFFLSGDWKMILASIKYKRYYNPTPIESHGCKRLGIAPIAFTDGPRGVVMGNSTCFPVPMARAAAFDRALEYEIGEAIGKEARAQGANYFAGVCINLLMHPAGGRAQESYGEDPYLVGEMGVQLVCGVQKHNVMACIKHYALNNMENLRFHIDVDCDERTLHEVYLPHFKKCVEAGCASLMGAYNRFRGEQASESKELLTDILRSDWGFEGFTITDFIYALRDGKKAIEAGMDMEMPLPVHFGMELKKAVEEGRLDESLLDRAILRILKTQFTFENTPDSMSYDTSLIACEKHIALARRAAEESMVLLKNRDGLLPFSKGKQNLLVIGHLADLPNTGDHGSSRVYPPYVVTALQGIREKAGKNARITYIDETDIAQIRQLAPTADAIIVIAGNDFNDEGEFVVPDKELNSAQLMAQGYKNNSRPFMSKLMKAGEKSGRADTSYTSNDGKRVGGDRKGLSLRTAEIDAIRTAGGLNNNTVVVLTCGSMIMTKEWDTAASAILYSWYSGMEGGHALADILWGDVVPSGKLPFSIPDDVEHLPTVDFFHADRIYYDYDHGYRKLDRDGNKAAYPFGYGLSYTNFSYGTVATERTQKGVTVKAAITNNGTYAGDEVVQVYVSFPQSSVKRHVKELKGFQRVHLECGETKEVLIELSESELKYYEPLERKWILEKTLCRIWVGGSSDEQSLKMTEIDL